MPINRIRQDLELREGALIPAGLLAVARKLEGRTLRPSSLKLLQMAEVVPDILPASRNININPFTYGNDYSFGINDNSVGEVLKVEDNAERAIFQGERGVENWRTIKTIAYKLHHTEQTRDPLAEIGEVVDEVVFVHLRGDREVDTVALAKHLNLKERGLQLSKADIEKYGLKRGTLSPLSEIDSNLEVDARHIFDLDLIGGDDFPGDDLVLTSSGDPRFYLALDIRRYIELVKGINFDLESVSMPMEKKERAFVSRDVEVITGDPPSSDLDVLIKKNVGAELTARKGNFGNRSLGKTKLISDSEAALSVDVVKNEIALRAFYADKLGNHAGHTGEPVLVLTSSVASERIASEEAEKINGDEVVKKVEVVRRQEAIENYLKYLESQGMEIERTLLMGLPSVYDPKHSPFKQEFLGDKGVSDGFKGAIQDIIAKNIADHNSGRKEAKIDSLTVYKIIQEELINIARDGNLDNLKGKTVAIVLGVSDIDSLLSAHHSMPKAKQTGIMFLTPRSSSEMIGEWGAVDKNPDFDDKIRVVLISPNHALAKLTAEKSVKVTNKVKLAMAA